MNYDLMFALCAVAYSIGLVAIGLVIGATVVSDWLHRVPSRPVKQQPEPVTTIVPYMVVLNGGRSPLDVPAVWRRGGKS